MTPSSLLDAAYYIYHLQLQPHPEGGYFKESYRSSVVINKDALPRAFGGSRNISTAIYYLLQQGDFSAFHRIRSDECWHYYAGDTLLIHMIGQEGQYDCCRLGRRIDRGESLQFVVPAHTWFAAEPAPGSAFNLAGCTVSPGFDFNDFEMAGRQQLIEAYPAHATLISRLTR